MALEAFRRIQIGRERTRGTALAADKVLVGTLTMGPRQTIHSPVDERNSLAAFKRDVLTGQTADLKFSGDATYQQILDFLAMSVQGAAPHVSGGFEPIGITPTKVIHSDDGSLTDLSNAYDDATNDANISGFVAADDYILVGLTAEKFRAMKYTAGTTPNAASSVITAVEVSTGTGTWGAATLIRDSTLDSTLAKSHNQSGIIEWEVPSSVTWASVTYDSTTAYWVRLTFGGNLTAGFDIDEYDVMVMDTVWSITPNLTSRNNQDAYTIEYGDDTQEWESAFCMIKSLRLDFALGESVTMEAEMFGHFPSKSTFTASLNELSTITEIVSNDLKVYINNTWATVGDTEKATLVMGGSINFETGLIPVKYADGTFDFSNFLEQKRHIEIELEMVIGTDGITEYDAWAAQTARVIRLKWTGPSLGGSNYILQLDVHGIYISEPELFTSRDGQNVMRLLLQSREDASGNEMAWVVTTSVATL